MSVNRFSSSSNKVTRESIVAMKKKKKKNGSSRVSKLAMVQPTSTKKVHLERRLKWHRKPTEA
jgi:hypothetical protein